MAYTENEQRILDMWPKFEDGSYVMHGDKVAYDYNGDEHDGDVVAIRFPGTRPFKHTFTLEIDDDRRISMAHYIIGSRVKRPAPKVLDADGVEIKVGDTVWGETGQEYEVTALCEHEPRIVRAMSVGGADSLGGELIGTSPHINSATLDASKLTHVRPAMDADGVPVKVGDKVWVDDEVDPCEVVKVRGGVVQIRYEDGYISEREASELTHQQPDSWERLEEDAESIRQTIARNFGDFSPSNFKQSGDSLQDRVSDLVRRAKALAEKEAER